MRTDELDYHLPESLIATEPATPRDSARLMLIDRSACDAQGHPRITHHTVRDLPTLAGADGVPIFAEGSLMLFNQTRVLPAYLSMTRSQTGGRLTGLFLHAVPGEGGRGPMWDLYIEARGTLQPGERLEFDTHADVPGGASLQLLERGERGKWRARLVVETTADGSPDSLTILRAVGATPLPPYIRAARKRLGIEIEEANDADRYNTVYAKETGSVAAPTAGLHFTPELLESLERRGVVRHPVTLHVGEGTFAPIRSDDLADHAMHTEWLSVPASTIDAIRRARANRHPIACVGTTTVRAVESLPPGMPAGDFTADTDLFIYPGSGFTFRHTDRLMTNFHLPCSTLLAMVATLPGVGLDNLKHCYRVAIAEQYRFYSFGDAMLVV